MKKKYLSIAFLGCAFFMMNFTPVKKPPSKFLKFNKDKTETACVQKKDNEHIEVLLLLALPASGKSEARKFLDTIKEEERLEKFKIGNMVQLDDFPYVFMMRRISEELENLGYNGAYYRSNVLPLIDPNDWGALIYLLNEDYEDIINNNKTHPVSASEWLFERLDVAREKNGQEPILSKLPKKIRKILSKKLEKESQNILNDKIHEISLYEKPGKKTIIIEFSRGGADGSSMPLPEPYGYRYSLPKLNKAILKKASILYINVSQEQSFDKNEKRADPNKPGSIMNHYVPKLVMYNDYGCDDINWMMDNSDRKNFIYVIKNEDQKYYIPISILENMTDDTSFIHKDESLWKKESIDKFHKSLKDSLEGLSSCEE